MFMNKPEAAAARLEKSTVAITIGVDGRIYCHDLTPDMLGVLAELCPGDVELSARQAAASALERNHE